MAAEANAQEAATNAEPDDTVFYLVPESAKAIQAVDRHRNTSIPVVTINGQPALRIALGCSRTEFNLVRLGTNNTDDIVLVGTKKESRCYFCFHRVTGDLMLYDVSPTSNTVLISEDLDGEQPMHTAIMGAGQSQCAVVLRPYAGSNASRVYLLTIGKAHFKLFPEDRLGHIPLSAKSKYFSTDNRQYSRAEPAAKGVHHRVV
ncbi:hypothetical protein F503_01637 [Ophiostoma piceae UAMH 11346]|uniref:Uncharacterized protein n=1 Tax=Ophiostoma piceae (strain UAMH 11346) TaxID=1262450 RepID=S3BTY6_OPHP1|nr:hypothetical protein F503_01637 [Ophiostoma piceae UAMH 11346]